MPDGKDEGAVDRAETESEQDADKRSKKEGDRLKDLDIGDPDGAAVKGGVPIWTDRSGR